MCTLSVIDLLLCILMRQAEKWLKWQFVHLGCLMRGGGRRLFVAVLRFANSGSFQV
jgi:hypothetical protein